MTEEMRIEKALKELGLENETKFTYKELTEISKLAKVDTIDVMFYLRYER